MVASEVPIYSAKQVTAQVIQDAKAKNLKVIGTHSATHHCDEVLSCVFLTRLYPNSIIIRQRDQEILDMCDIVVDVGGKYSPEENRFDHHQTTFTERWRGSRTVRLSSAGLVWKHFGLEILKKIAPQRTQAQHEILHDVLYDTLIESIDAGDNGTRPCGCKAEHVYYIGGFPGLSGLVGACNTSWLVWTSESECFKKAMDIVEQWFMPIMEQLANNWFEAVEECQQAERIPVPEHPDFAVIQLKEYYPFHKFFRYILGDDAEGLRVVGVIWSPAEDVWCTSFRPWKWLDRSRKQVRWQTNEELKTKEDVLNRISTMLTEFQIHHGSSPGSSLT